MAIFTNKVFEYDGKLFLNEYDLQSYLMVKHPAWNRRIARSEVDSYKKMNIVKTKYVPQSVANTIAASQGDKQYYKNHPETLYVEIKYDSAGTAYFAYEEGVFNKHTVYQTLSQMSDTREEARKAEAIPVSFEPVTVYVTKDDGGDNDEDLEDATKPPEFEDEKITLEKLMTAKTEQLKQEQKVAAMSIYVKMLNMVEQRKIIGTNIGLVEENIKLAKKQSVSAGREFIINDMSKYGVYKTSEAYSGVMSGGASAILERNKYIAKENRDMAIEAGNIQIGGYERDIETMEASQANILDQIALYSQAMGYLHHTYNRDSEGNLLPLDEVTFTEDEDYYETLETLEMINTAMEWAGGLADIIGAFV